MVMSKPQQTSTTAQVIRRRQLALATRKGYVDLIVRVFLLLAAGYLLFSKVFLILPASGNEMFPAIKDGDLVLAYRLQRSYAKDDVVVYMREGRQRIGRIAARTTDVIMMDDSGSYRVNGTAQSGEIVYPTYAKEAVQYPYKVPENSVFLLGDYRTTAVDSRDFGTVNMQDIMGKVITILRRRGL